MKYWYFKTLAVTIGPNNNTDGPWQTHQDEQGTKFGLMSLHISGQHILKKLNYRRRLTEHRICSSHQYLTPTHLMEQ